MITVPTCNVFGHVLYMNGYVPTWLEKKTRVNIYLGKLGNNV